MRGPATLLSSIVLLFALQGCLFDTDSVVMSRGDGETPASSRSSGALTEQTLSYDLSHFHISCWQGVPEDQTTLANYQLLADAGFTMAPLYSSKSDRAEWLESITAQLDMCQTVGILGRVYDPKLVVNYSDSATCAAIPDNVAEVYADYGSHPAFGCYHVSDEPDASQFAGLAKVCLELAAIDPVHIPYLNLFPNYAQPAQLGAANYGEYVRGFIEVVAPPYVSYDHYCLGTSGEVWDQHYFFPNLHLVRYQSQLAGVPFRQIIQATWIDDAHRFPLEPDLRWQVWSTILYGGRGIEYFVYYPGSSFNSYAILDGSGTPTPVYDQVRTINEEIHRLEPYIMHMNSVGMFHSTRLARGYRPPDAVSKYVTATNCVACSIGEFEFDDGRDGVALVVLNRELGSSISVTFTVDASFNYMQIVDRATGARSGSVPLAPVDGGVQGTVELEAGAAELVLLSSSTTSVSYR